jgi:hypothetical protein
MRATCSTHFTLLDLWSQITGTAVCKLGSHFVIFRRPLRHTDNQTTLQFTLPSNENEQTDCCPLPATRTLYCTIPSNTVLKCTCGHFTCFTADRRGSHLSRGQHPHITSLSDVWLTVHRNSVWIRKTKYMSLFVFFISLLIVAQHVSGNHVPIIRS